MLCQFTGSRSSCPRSSEDSDIRSLSQTCSQSLRTLSPVGSSVGLPVYFVDDGFLLAVILLLFAHFADKLRLRWPFILAGLLSSAVGYGINISNASNGAKYFGTFLCVTGVYSSSPGIVAW